ncbi:MAG: PaaI family thioesterase [Roseiarcus sp.]
MPELERLNAHILPFAETLGVEYVSANLDEVVGRLVVRPELCTLGSFAHGGALMSFADTLGGAAAFLNLPQGAKATTTLSSQTQLVGAAPEGTVLIARCTPIHRGQRSSVWETRVETEDGRLISVTTQTQMTL